jgi:catechol 2,3-dioxygenase
MSDDVTASAPRDPEELEAGGAPASGLAPPDTHPGAVHLGVADLARSLAYYVDTIGLVGRNRDAATATLGGERDLLVLHERPGARPADGYSGLYHFALLVPDRADLARWLAHAVRDRVPLAGLSDHFVSEAIYLRDPDHHGIEIYWDRPRAMWEGQVAERMTTLPLDTDDLFATLADPAREPFDGLPGATIMGHVHLRVADIADTVAFYRDVIGFGVMAQLGAQATFLSAGGYHHHIGANVWESRGRRQAPAGSATLERALLRFPDQGSRDAAAARAADAGQDPQAGPAGVVIHDPSGNPLELVAGRD